MTPNSIFTRIECNSDVAYQSAAGVNAHKRNIPCFKNFEGDWMSQHAQ